MGIESRCKREKLGVTLRIGSIVLIAALMTTMGFFFGAYGALAALPIAIAISVCTERFVSRADASQSIDNLRRRRE